MSNTCSSSDDDTDSISSFDGTCLLLESNVLINAELLRNEARQLYQKAKQASSQSRYEYSCGYKAKAKRLSIIKNGLYMQNVTKNNQAAELIFNYFNQGRPDDVIDLNRLSVVEALGYLQKKTSRCRLKNILQLEVITGEGCNASYNADTIKPYITRFAHENNLTATVNIGHVIIDLAPKTAYKTTSSKNINECIIL